MMSKIDISSLRTPSEVVGLIWNTIANREECSYAVFLWKNLDTIMQKKFPNVKTTFEWLNQLYPDFHKINIYNDSCLIFGPPQSGKSEFSFSVALKHSVCGIPTVFVCRNYIGDAKHLEFKARLFREKHLDYLTENDINNRTFSIAYAGDMSISGSAGNHTLINYEKILSLICSEETPIIFCLSNGSQLKAVNMLFELTNTIPILIIDEADAIGYTEALENPPLCHKPIELEVLRNRSHKTFEVSATIWDNLVGNTSLLSDQIIRLTPSKNYRSSLSVKYVNLRYKLLKWTPGMSVFEEDPNLRTVIRTLEEISLYCGFHPVIMLFKTKSSKAHHKNFLREFSESPLNEKWTTIMECDEGVFIHDARITQEIIICGFRSVFENNTNFFRANTILIPQLLQWLKDNTEQYGLFTHIMIKSGNLSGRSRSYVSTDGEWHLTHEYYHGSTSAAGYLQDQRLLHNRPDSIPLVQFASQKVNDDIKKAYLIQEEILDRLLSKRTPVLVANQVREELMSIMKVPKVKLCCGTKNKSFKVKKTKKYDHGTDLDIYEQEITKSVSLNSFSSTLSSHKEGIFREDPKEARKEDRKNDRKKDRKKDAEENDYKKTDDPTITWLSLNLTAGRTYTGSEVRKLADKRMAGNIVYPFVLVGSRIQFCNQPLVGKYQVDDALIKISQPDGKKSTLYFEVLDGFRII